MRQALLPTSLARFCTLGLSLAACSSSSTVATSDAGHHDAPTSTDTGTTTKETGPKADTGGSTGDAAGKVTIAAAITGKMFGTPITVRAVVTGLHGAPPGDITLWYIEDPAGGQHSGIVVYCDPVKASCPASVRAPVGPYATVDITGSISTYMGSLQFTPTAQTVVTATGSAPPIATITAADVLPTANSPYRGVLAKLTDKLTVDSVTPMALYNTTCATTTTTTDAGKTDASVKADAGPTLCTGCTPPTYSGFRAKDSASNELYIEDFFFSYDHYQSSPECTTQAGEKAVTVGETFSSLTGIIDYDGYATAQAFYPISDADVVTP